ncbi:hypothetical protein SUGI_1016840 [Cryptomeria japonica]|nr:hypothetical protein SUGI_1016840 [Cryptomeria japonica]
MGGMVRFSPYKNGSVVFPDPPMPVVLPTYPFHFTLFQEIYATDAEWSWIMHNTVNSYWPKVNTWKGYRGPSLWE